MDHYINIQLLSDDEIPLYFIRNKVFAKFHKALYDNKQTSIGVSFPNYKEKLGDIIRLHGSKGDLSALQNTKWLGGLSGYCEISVILPVPDTVEGYRTVSRKQSTMSLDKLKKRVEFQVSRGDLKDKKGIEAYEKQYMNKMNITKLNYPYLALQSNSTHNNYQMFIACSEIKDSPVAGKFSYFGLSKKATIPWFT